MEANPFECFMILAVAFWPVFDLVDLRMRSNAEAQDERD
jgi:hypothetical protein